MCAGRLSHTWYRISDQAPGEQGVQLVIDRFVIAHTRKWLKTEPSGKPHVTEKIEALISLPLPGQNFRPSPHGQARARP